jgi:hypothetical protein
MTLRMTTKFGTHVPKKPFQYWVLQTGMKPCKICEELSKHEATSNKDPFSHISGLLSILVRG